MYMIWLYIEDIRRVYDVCNGGDRRSAILISKGEKK